MLATAVMPGPVLDQPALDSLRLDMFSGGDPAIERVLLELYLQTAATYLESLELAQENVEAWQRVAHALKGASANIGAVRIAEIARQAENASPNAAMVRAIGRELDLIRGRLAELA